VESQISSIRSLEEFEAVPTMITSHKLASLPPDQWRVDQVIIFDWFDGPRHGIARLAQPSCELMFDLLAERPNDDGLDDRLFRIWTLPDGSVSRILHSISALGVPADIVWLPLWKFPSEEERIRADEEIETVLNQKETTGLVIFTRDFHTFLGCWKEHIENSQIHDWARYLLPNP
jgi:hypothetical protein